MLVPYSINSNDTSDHCRNLIEKFDKRFDKLGPANIDLKEFL